MSRCAFLLVASACASLCGPTLAQIKLPETVPPGYVSAATPGQSIFKGQCLGTWSDQRLQLFSGYLKQVAILREIQFRPHGYAMSSATARSWNTVRLSLADGDFANVSTSYSANLLSTPTRVFQGSVTWPDLSTRPVSTWGVGGLRFPFASVYVHYGRRDLLFDYTFTGGSLANNGPWINALYGLDAVSDVIRTGSVARGTGNRTCVSSLSNYPVADILAYHTHTWAKKTGNPATDNMIEGDPMHWWGAANTLHIGAVSGTSSGGIQVGACQLLMIRPMFYMTYVTDSAGRWVGPRTWVKFQPSLVGVSVLAQTAHLDRGRLHLSLLSTHRISPQPLRFDVKMLVGTRPANTGWIWSLAVPLFLLK